MKLDKDNLAKILSLWLHVEALTPFDLDKNDLIEQTQLPMAKAMLRAAAFTYVAGVLSTMLQLLRIFLMTRRDER